MAEVAHCERSENRGSGGGGFKTDHLEAVPQLILVALAVVFEADVPRGNWVTVGFDSPLVRPSTCIGGRRSKKKAMEELEKIGVRLSKGARRVKVADGC